ncbi:MAG: PRC-barrel domain-containing protein, partial [Cyanobacteria bacterium J06638_6]
MALYTLEKYYPNYRDELGDNLKDIKSYDVYAEGDNQVGSVKDLLVDESGLFRYAVVDTGPWIFGKTVLLPIGLARFDHNRSRVYVDGLSRQQVENLPDYQRDQIVDDQYESQVRDQYRAVGQRRTNRQFMGQTVENSRSVEGTAAVEASTPVGSAAYDREPALYGMSEEDNQQTLKLYEERLVTNLRREKVGE